MLLFVAYLTARRLFTICFYQDYVPNGTGKYDILCQFFCHKFFNLILVILCFRPVRDAILVKNSSHHFFVPLGTDKYDILCQFFCHKFFNLIPVFFYFCPIRDIMLVKNLLPATFLSR